MQNSLNRSYGMKLKEKLNLISASFVNKKDSSYPLFLSEKLLSPFFYAPFLLCATLPPIPPKVSEKHQQPQVERDLRIRVMSETPTPYERTMLVIENRGGPIVLEGPEEIVDETRGIRRTISGHPCPVSFGGCSQSGSKEAIATC